MNENSFFNGSIGVIFGSRNIFNAQLVAGAKADLALLCGQLGVKTVFPQVTNTTNAAVETLDDARICARVLSAHREEISGIVVVLANFGDEIGVAEAIRMSELRVPVLVQASDDDTDKVDVDSRRDAFCGKLSVCNNLKQYGIPYSLTTNHTENIASALFRSDLEDFLGVCRVVAGLRHGRIAQFGVRPAGFQTVRFSEKLLQASGITVVPVDFASLLERARLLQREQTLVEDKVQQVRDYGKVPERITGQQFINVASFSLAIEQYMDELDCQAASILCWDSLEYHFGCASCATMSMLGERLMPFACESDIAGAVSMYALTLAARKPSALLDWNNNYGDEPELCVCTHCSNYPKSFMGNELEISELDILGKTIGRERCFGAIKGKVAAGPFTFVRFSTDDTKGRIIGYLGEGDFLDKSFPMDGGIAVTAVPKLQKLMRTICANGFEHHVAMVRGHHARIVNEAVTRYLGWKLYWHEGDRDQAEIL